LVQTKCADKKIERRSALFFITVWLIYDAVFTVAGFLALAVLVFFAFAALLDFAFFATFVALAGLSADSPAGKHAFMKAWRSVPVIFCVLASVSHDARVVCALAEAAKNGSAAQIAANIILVVFFIRFPLKVKFACRAK
jgi:hypothetical protein